MTTGAYGSLTGNIIRDKEFLKHVVLYLVVGVYYGQLHVLCWWTVYGMMTCMFCLTSDMIESSMLITMTLNRYIMMIANNVANSYTIRKIAFGY